MTSPLYEFTGDNIITKGKNHSCGGDRGIFLNGSHYMEFLVVDNRSTYDEVLERLEIFHGTWHCNGKR